jgi:hypothetical protein
MGFHQTFLNILRGNDPLQNNQLNTHFDFNVLPKTPQTVAKIAPFVTNKLMKNEQQLIETHDTFYVARDTCTNTVYMCFKNLLMLDIDEVGDEATANHLSRLSASPEKFVVFQSNRGLHAFCVSKAFEYRNLETIQFMIDHGADFYYTTFCYVRGFCVRLNKKMSEPAEKPMYVRLGYIGNGNVVQELESLVNKHVEYCRVYSTSSINTN